MWKPSMSIIDAKYKAEDVRKPTTGIRIGMRLPPTMDPAKARDIITDELRAQAPYDCKIWIYDNHFGKGWSMKAL